MYSVEDIVFSNSVPKAKKYLPTKPDGAMTSDLTSTQYSL